MDAKVGLGLAGLAYLWGCSAALAEVGLSESSEPEPNAVQTIAVRSAAELATVDATPTSDLLSPEPSQHLAAPATAVPLQPEQMQPPPTEIDSTAASLNTSQIQSTGRSIKPPASSGLSSAQQPQKPETAAIDDPLERLSTSEWLQLLSEPEPSEPKPSKPVSEPEPSEPELLEEQEAVSVAESPTASQPIQSRQSNSRSNLPQTSALNATTLLQYGRAARAHSSSNSGSASISASNTDKQLQSTAAAETMTALNAAPPSAAPISRSATDLLADSNSTVLTRSGTRINRSTNSANLIQSSRFSSEHQDFVVASLGRSATRSSRTELSRTELSRTDSFRTASEQSTQQSERFDQTNHPLSATTVASSSAPLLASDPMAQVTSVSQLADVQPTDWAYQALQSLVERYGVIEGYPDGLFRGDRALTRYEFAAGINAAMDRVTQLVDSTTNAITKSDLDTLSRLQDDFATELAGLRGRVDGLEARVAELSANQFSTTVVLNGQVTFGLADAWGGDPPGLGETNPVFAYLTQLQLSGSFSERDAFRIDLDAGNFARGGFADPQALNTQMALMGWQTDTNNSLDVSGIEYRFAVGDRLVFTLKPVGFSLDTVLSPNSIYSSVSQGALSRFAAQNPIFRIGSLDAGLGLDWLVTDRLRLQLAYGARDASDPEQGLIKSDHRAFGVQLLARPFSTVTTGVAYINAFASDGFLDTFTGSTNADVSGGFLEPAAIHAVGGTLQWQIVPSVILGAWGGLAVTDSLPSDAVAVSSTYLFSLGFPDTFGREGDLLGVMVGQPFRLRTGIFIEAEDQGSGLHYEMFYRIRVNDHIAITPGVFVVTDPGHVPDNDTIVVAAVRTSFLF